jgi:hypothetical protein
LSLGIKLGIAKGAENSIKEGSPLDVKLDIAEGPENHQGWLIAWCRDQLQQRVEDSFKDGGRDGNEMACCMVSSAAMTKGLKTA